LNPTSVRLTDSERTTLEECAQRHRTTVGALIRKAAVMMAANMGAAPRTDKKNRPEVVVKLYPMDIPALDAYKIRNECTTRAQAILFAMRSTLVARGDLTLNADQNPDQDTCMQAMGHAMPGTPQGQMNPSEFDTIDFGDNP
jgi:hypothetical protein